MADHASLLSLMVSAELTKKQVIVPRANELLDHISGAQ